MEFDEIKERETGSTLDQENRIEKMKRYANQVKRINKKKALKHAVKRIKKKAFGKKNIIIFVIYLLTILINIGMLIGFYWNDCDKGMWTWLLVYTISMLPITIIVVWTWGVVNVLVIAIHYVFKSCWSVVGIIDLAQETTCNRPESGSFTLHIYCLSILIFHLIMLVVWALYEVLLFGIRLGQGKIKKPRVKYAIPPELLNDPTQSKYYKPQPSSTDYDEYTQTSAEEPDLSDEDTHDDSAPLGDMDYFPIDDIIHDSSSSKKPEKPGNSSSTLATTTNTTSNVPFDLIDDIGDIDPIFERTANPSSH